MSEDPVADAREVLAPSYRRCGFLWGYHVCFVPYGHAARGKILDHRCGCGAWTNESQKDDKVLQRILDSFKPTAGDETGG